jgi:hypothetical protein
MAAFWQFAPTRQSFRRNPRICGDATGGIRSQGGHRLLA